MAAFRGGTCERAMGPAFERKPGEEHMQIAIRRFRQSALGTAAFLGVTLAWGGFADAHGSHELRGHLTTHQVDCDSLCTEGPITGDLTGTLDFTLDSLDATPTPNVSRYVGVNTIRTR